MKKIFLLFLSLFAIILTSCSEEDDKYSGSPYTEFKDYATFSANKFAWEEPSDYTFTYKYSLQAVHLQSPVTVNVKDGVSSFTFPDNFQEEHYEKLASITEVYECFEKHWNEMKAEKNDSLGIRFSATYGKTDSNLAYPKVLYEDITWVKSGDAPVGADSGGLRIEITEFKEN